MKFQIVSVMLLFVVSGVVSVQFFDIVCDYDSIFVMQGEYIVDFVFDEIVLLKFGYECVLVMCSGGNELVIVVEDMLKCIVLQYLLLDEKSGYIIKYWCQDWVYEVLNCFEFSVDQIWQVCCIFVVVNQGVWIQCVYEVSDVLCYCGIGKWMYINNVLSWISDLSWWLLLCCEYIKCSDYNVLVVVNCYMFMFNGWIYEQFNIKVQCNVDGSQVEIVCEFGFNDYVRIIEINFILVCNYWKVIVGYWVKVCQCWDGFFGQVLGVYLKIKFDGMVMIILLFIQVEVIQFGKKVKDVQIDEVFVKYVEKVLKEG